MSSDLVEIKQDSVEDQKSSPSFQLTSPSDDFLALFGVMPAISGVNVSPISAMRVPAVRAAVTAISEALGQIEAHVYSTGAGDAKKAPEHPVYALLHDNVNPWTTASFFREQLTQDALLYGNGYAAITRVEGQPVELTRLRPDAVTVLVNPDTMEPLYRYTPLSGAAIEYGFQDILHLHDPSSNGVIGESRIEQAREAIGLAMVMEQHAARLFANGARPAGSLNVPGTLTPDAVARIKAQVTAMHAGSASGSTMVLEQGAKFEQLAFTSVDSEFSAQRQFAISEISRVFRINPILLGEMGRATFSNSAEMGKQFVNFTLLPWVKRWCGEIALKLFSTADRKAYSVVFDTDGFDRLDLNTRATGYSTMVAARVMNPNECRALEGLPPVAGGDQFLNPNIDAIQENVSV